MIAQDLKLEFDQVVRLHRPSIYRFICGCVRDESLAEDLTQECFWRASRGWTDFRGDSSVQTWLRHIAQNVINNNARGKGRQLWRSAPAVETVPDEYLMDDRSSPEAAAILRDRLQTIWKAAARVPPKQHVALQLRFVDDLEVIEIAQIMGISEGSVKVHLFRAVQSIRMMLRVSA